MQIRARYQPHPESTCAKVMAFARQRNSRELMRLLRDGYALGERSHGHDAVFYLALAGDFESAKYLERSQAFRDPLKTMMLGAALGGYDQEVDRLFERHDDSREYPSRDILHRHLAYYYALGGHVYQVNARLQMISSPQYRYGQVHQIIYFYALNGSCQSEIDVYYNKIKHIAGLTNKTVDDVRSNFEMAINQAYAEQGLIMDENRLLGSAKGGHEEFVHRVLAAKLNDIDSGVKAYQSNMETRGEDWVDLLTKTRELCELYVDVAKAALNHSPAFAFSVIKQRFSYVDRIIDYIIDHGYLSMAFDSLALLHKSYLMDDFFSLELKARLLESAKPTFQSVSVWDEIDAHLIDPVIKFIEGACSFDAVQAYKFSDSVDPGIIDEARDSSKKKFQDLLFDKTFISIKEKRYATVNMLSNAWVSSFGSDEFPELNLSSKLNYDEVLFMAASIDHLGMRRALSCQLVRDLPECFEVDAKVEVMLSHAAWINRLMRHYLLDFYQVKVLMGSNAVDARHWLQVYRFSDDNLSLPTNVFSAIFSMLLGVNENDAQMIYEAILLNIFERQPTGMYLENKLDVFGLFARQPGPAADAVDVHRLPFYQSI